MPGFLKNLRTSTRVVIAGLVITGFFVLTTFVWLLPRAERALIQRKREQIREATEIAWGILNYYRTEEQQGRLTLAEAQSQASAMVAQIRYGPQHKDYFWINDMQPRMVMHPYRQDLNGHDLTEYRDPRGKALFVEFVNVVREHGQGFVDYLWQWQDESDKVVPKISYVRQFRPWNWIVGTGIYIEDVKSEIRRWRLTILLVYAIVALLGVAISAYSGQEVARRVRHTAVSGVAGQSRAADEDRGEWRVGLRVAILTVLLVPAVALALLWSVELYRELSDIIIEGFDGELGAVSAVTGAFIRGEDHRTISASRDEESELYRAYARSMRAVRDSTGMSYLYTQELVGGDCRYVLDVSDEWDTIGAREALSADDYEGARNVMLHGIVHVGDIEQTENWGLLKYAYGPILNEDGTVEAMVGADVDIAVIRDRLSAALFSVSLMCIICLVLGTYVSLAIAQRLVVPVNEVKERTLRVAAGEFDRPIEVASPTEVRELSARFNAVGTALSNALSSLRSEQAQLQERLLSRDLLALVDRSACDGHECAAGRCRCAVVNRNAPDKDAAGWTTLGDMVVLWCAEPVSPSFRAVRMRSDCARIARAIWTRDQGDAAQTLRAVADAMPEAVTAVFVVPRDGGVVHFRATPETTVVSLGGDPVATVQSVEGSGRLSIERERCLLIVSDTRVSVDTVRDALAGLTNACREPQKAFDALVSVLEDPQSPRQRMIGVVHG